MAPESSHRHRRGLIFLSHASEDKLLVERVLAHIPQSHVFYDIRSIDAGAVDLEAIEGAVLSTDVFVLFLSKASRTKGWVGFETTLARLQTIKQTNCRIIIVPLGEETSQGAPKWMQSYSCTSPQYTVKDIARTISAALNEVLAASGMLRPPLFIGRESFCNLVVVEILTRLARGDSTNFLVFAGIDQMGRGTAVAHLAPQIFPGLRQTGPIFDLPPFADSLDLFLALRDEIDDQLSVDRMRNLKALFTVMSPLEQVGQFLTI